MCKYKLSSFVNFASVYYQSQYFEMSDLIKPIQKRSNCEHRYFR